MRSFLRTRHTLWIWSATTCLLATSPGTCFVRLLLYIFLLCSAPRSCAKHLPVCLLYILLLPFQRLSTFGMLHDSGKVKSLITGPTAWSSSLHAPICHLSSHLANHSPESLQKPSNARWRPPFPLLPLSLPYFSPLSRSSNLCIISFLPSCLL